MYKSTLSLALFNLIPIPPLDGSKVLFSFLPYHWSRLRWQIERYGLILVFAIIILPTLFGINVIGDALGTAVTFVAGHIAGLSLGQVLTYLNLI